jgi:hypothetical protein
MSNNPLSEHLTVVSASANQGGWINIQYLKIVKKASACSTGEIFEVLQELETETAETNGFEIAELNDTMKFKMVVKLLLTAVLSGRVK